MMEPTCEMCEMPATHLYYWGHERIHAYCELHDQAVADDVRAVFDAACARELASEYEVVPPADRAAWLLANGSNVPAE